MIEQFKIVDTFVFESLMNLTRHQFQTFYVITIRHEYLKTILFKNILKLKFTL